MTSFGELFTLFPEQVMELCLQECFACLRPVWYWDDAGEWSEKCEFCDRQALQIWRGDEYDRWSRTYTSPLPNSVREHHCGSPRCEEMAAWWFHPELGRKRHGWFFKLTGQRFFSISKETRLDVAAAYVLIHEANKIIHDKKKRRIAA